MGIRFDKDSRRATNGAMIFFSDPSSQQIVAEEIRGAIVSGLCFYCYRLPGSTMLSFGSSEGYLEGLEEPGFVIGLFNPALPVITIPYSGVNRKQENGAIYNFPEKSTSCEEYEHEVGGIIQDLKSMAHGKVVACRVSVKEERQDPAEIFFDLNSRFPEAMVFCFYTPATGFWIGASPELLLMADEQGVESMALAGTRPAGSEEAWDGKNVEEQQIVVDYIMRIFSAYGLQPVKGETFSRKTGKIEHICTPVWGIPVDSQKELAKLLKELSPTPALCGQPKEFALEEIKKYEKFDRGCYGGFCGPFHSVRDFSFNVVLRCASLNERKICYYTGGGITSESEIKKEWIETKLKLENTFPSLQEEED